MSMLSRSGGVIIAEMMPIKTIAYRRLFLKNFASTIPIRPSRVMISGYDPGQPPQVHIVERVSEAGAFDALLESMMQTPANLSRCCSRQSAISTRNDLLL